MKRVHVVIVTDTGDYLSNKILGNDSKIILKMGYDLGFQTSIGNGGVGFKFGLAVGG